MATNLKPKQASAKGRLAGGQEYIYAVGRRKTAVARVRLYVKTAKVMADQKSQIVINGKSSEAYFPDKTSQVQLWEPLRTSNTADKFTATIKVEGGGKRGQLGAVIHGLSRAIVKADSEAYRKILKSQGFLTRDPRMRERRKIGTGGKARRQKQSPKR